MEQQTMIKQYKKQRGQVLTQEQKKANLKAAAIRKQGKASKQLAMLLSQSN